MENCQNCPLKDSDVVCPAISRQHIRFCYMADPQHPLYNRDIERTLYIIINTPNVSIKSTSEILDKSQSFPVKAEYTPDFLEKVKNVGGALGRFVKIGMKTVSEKTKQKRLSICQGCEYYDKELMKCNVCGCYLEVKTKMASESCPLNKWGVELPGKSGCGC
jgi:hypothetical protein